MRRLQGVRMHYCVPEYALNHAPDWARGLLFAAKKQLKSSMKKLIPGTGPCRLWNRLRFRAGHAVTIFFCAWQGMAQAAVEVTPQRVEETRALIFKDDKVGRPPASLKLTLALDGPEAEAATQYGHVKLDEATDSSGASLIPSHHDSFHDPLKFRDYGNAFFRHSSFGKNTESAKPQVEIELGFPSRAAARIARLRGSLDVSDGGKTNTVELGALKRGEKTEVPLPKGCPVGVGIVVGSGDSIRSISLQCTGDDNALASIEIVDGTGKRVSTGMSSWSIGGGPVQKSFGLSKALDDSMKLVVKVISDRKFTNVTFDLKDIALP